MRKPPYNTGRVRIGVAYVPPPQPIRSMDAIKLQSALLDRRTEQPTHPIRKLLAPIVRWL
jgi:hypothetical protein